MTTGEVVNAIINLGVALGTIALAILAVYGDCIRSWLTGPRLSLVIADAKPSPFPTAQGEPRWYWFLKVVNSRPSASATNCVVQLKTLSRRLSNGDFADIRLAYSLVLYWPPREFTAWTKTVRQNEPVDFGYVAKGSSRFAPSARAYPLNFAGFLEPNGTMRYGFEIVSDQFVSPTLHEFEVSWDGEWTDDVDDMANHLKIRQLTR
jgi:hypothetical protein